MDEFSFPSAIQAANEVLLENEQRVFSQGQAAENYLVVIRGCLRVFARSGEGKEVVLYRVKDGEMCILTTACLLGRTNYPAEAVTESDTVVRLIPSALFDQLLNESKSFRQFVFEGLSRRLAQVLQRFEQIVLDSVHHRLANFLLQHASEDGVIEATHDKLATEIGTAREVVSRHLNSMAKAGLIKTQRGKVTILQPGALITFDRARSAM